MSYTTETIQEKNERYRKELLELYEELESLKKPYSKYLLQRIEIKRQIAWREKYFSDEFIKFLKGGK